MTDSCFSEELSEALLNAHCPMKMGFPYPDWNAIHDEAEKLDPAVLHRFWNGIADAWLTRMQEGMGELCDFCESANFKLLWTDESVNGERFLKKAEEYLRDINERLAGIVSDEGYGPHVIFLFGDVEQYYAYTGEFDGEREEIVATGGVMLSTGYIHIALAPQSSWNLEYTLLHELVHCVVAHLNLPLWVNEGLAMLVEWSRIGQNRVTVDHGVLEEHLNYWDAETIQQFWSGESFSLDDVSQKLSYELADILRRLIVSDFAKNSKSFVNFVNEAKWEDAGEAAARRHLGVGLGEIVGRFLGEGEWAPVPQEPLEH